MNIDKPLCNLKTCRYCHDGNCFLDYERCEYTLAKRQHGEWIDEGVYADNVGQHVYTCTHCNEHIVDYPSEMGSYCKYCGSDNRPKEGEANEQTTD